MADYSSLNGEFSIKRESEIHDEFGGDELDHIPFKKRLKMLLASNLDSGRDVLERESKRLKMSPTPIDVAIKVEQALYPSQELLNHYAASITDVKDRILLQEPINAYAIKIPATLCSQITISSQDENYPQDRNRQETQTNDSISSDQINCPDAKGGIVALQQVDANIPNLTEHKNLTTSTVKVKVECSDSDLMGGGRDGTEDPDLANDELIGVKIGIRDEPTADDILHQDLNRQETETNYSVCLSQKAYSEAKDGTILMKKVDTDVHNPARHPNLTTSIVKVKVEYSDSDRGRNDTKDPDQANVESSNDPPTDDLDHIPLNERKRILLIRQTLGTVGQLHISGLLEGTSVALSGDLMDGTYQHNVRKVEEESHSVDEQHSLTRNESHNISESNASELLKSSEASAELKSSGVQENGQICSTHSTQKISAELKSLVRQHVLTAIPDNLRVYHSKKKKKTNLRGSSLSDFLVKMEVETFESSLESSHKDTVGTYLNGNLLAVKGETGVSYESYEDELDHMPLRQRIKLLISRKVSHLDNSKNLKRFRKTVPSVLERIPAVPVNAKHGRKRKKTSTDSVETALEEDAPGLLQVLTDKGILVDEIKLYGAMENEEALDSSFEEDSFGDLEAVISKLFSERSSLLKFAPLRCPKGSKDTYCLSCLISLVEQSRYLRFRNWPVEWGWCRDLQSFIFVFERHNRIVLERPQYGYATYFFELVDSLPVHWQVKRLVIAMKLTSCSRATIIENKQLLVGEHLTEGEARVLEEYGWIPNSGLGSMLNYRDRVVHDKSNERDGAEWRSKIGKLLMNGYDGGTIIMTNLPKRFMEYKSTSSSQIKLEPFM